MREKGVSVLVGFILLMMILMLFLSVIQSVGVPKICEKYEAETMNSYLESFSKLSSELVRGESATLMLEGVYYPNYLFLLTPSPSSFSLVTKNESIYVSFQALLPNGSVQNFEVEVPSKLIVLTPGFYYYPSNKLIFENTAVFRKVSSKMIVVSQQKMVGAGVTVVGITGKDISISSSSPQSFYFSLLSSGNIDVKNVTLTFNSVNPDYWREVGAIVNGSRVTFKLNNTVLYFRIYGLEYPKNFGVKENFGGRIFMLKNSKVSITAGQTVELGIEVVNDYFQPIAGVNVSVDATGGKVSLKELKTNVNGIAEVSFTAKTAGVYYVTFTTPYGKATYQVTVTAVSLPFGRGPFNVRWVNKSELDSYYGNVWNASKDVEKTLEVSVSYNGEPVNGVNVNFVSTNTSVVSVPAQNTTVNGYAEVNAIAENNGSSTLIAYVAGSYDTLNLSVIGVPSNPILRSWWNFNWKYRVPINITYSGTTTLYDYQIEVVLDSNFNWNHVSSDAKDIRFVDSNNQLLPYWIEYWNYSQKEAIIWVKLSEIKPGTTTIYMYYGNSNANGEGWHINPDGGGWYAGNGSSVFLFFDDFQSNDLGKYYSNDINKWSVNTTGGVLESNPDSKDYVYVLGFGSYNNVIVEAKGRWTSSNDDFGLLVSEYSNLESGMAVWNGYLGFWGLVSYSNYGSGLLGFPVLETVGGESISENTWALIYEKVSGGSVAGYITDYSTYVSTQSINPIPTQYSGNYVGLFFWDDRVHAQFDWVFVRKYVSNPPTVSVGVEQSY